MTTRIRATLAAGLLALAAVAVTPAAWAQDSGRPGGRGLRGGPGGPMGMLGGFGPELRGLDLTDDQRGQVRTIVQAREAEMKEIGQRMRTAQQALHAAITADTVDEATIRSRSAELASVQSDSAVLRARVHNEIFSILTAEQQARAKELRASRKARRQGA